MIRGNNFTFFRKESDRKKYVLLACCALSLDIIIRFIVIFLTKLPFGSLLSSLFAPALFIVLILLNINSDAFKNIRQTDWLLILVFYLYSIFSFVVNVAARSYILKYWNYIVLIAPLFYLFGITFPTDYKMKKAWLVLAKIIIFVDIAYVVYALVGSKGIQEDAMERAYRMAPGIMLMVFEFFETRKIKDFLCAAICSIYLLTCGTRGPVLVLSVYWLYCLMFVGNTKWWRKALSSIIIAGVVLLYFSPLFYSIISSLADTSAKFGLSTRVFEEIMQGTFISNDNGRSVIYQEAYELIKQNPFGYGIYGEWSAIGWNVHNFYLQFILHFGVILGPILLVLFISCVVRALINNNNKYAKNFIIIFACFVFVKGFAGGSYIDWECAFLLGLSIKEIRNKKLLYSKVI